MKSLTVTLIVIVALTVVVKVANFVRVNYVSGHIAVLEQLQPTERSLSYADPSDKANDEYGKILREAARIDRTLR